MLKVRSVPAGGVRLELISWKSGAGALEAGPLASFLLPFSLHALQSKQLLSVQQDQLLTYLSAPDSEAQGPKSCLHTSSQHGPQSCDRWQPCCEQPAGSGSPCSMHGRSHPKSHGQAWPGEEAMSFQAEAGHMPAGCYPDVMHAHSSPRHTAWPFLDPQSAGGDNVMEMCSPEECFLRITAMLSGPDGTGSHLSNEATETSCQNVGNEHSAAANWQCNSACDLQFGQDEAQPAQHERGARMMHSVSDRTINALHSVAAMFSDLGGALWQRFADQQAPSFADDSPDDTSMSGRQTVESTIRDLIRQVSKPHKQHMQELHATPSPLVMENLAAVPHMSQAQVFFAEFKHATVVKPNIQMSGFTSLSPRIVEFCVSSDQVAAYVALETVIPGKFSDNGLLLLPWQSVHVAFLAEEGLQPEALEDTLKFLSLFDTSFAM